MRIADWGFRNEYNRTTNHSIVCLSSDKLYSSVQLCTQKYSLSELVVDSSTVNLPLVRPLSSSRFQQYFSLLIAYFHCSVLPVSID